MPRAEHNSVVSRFRLRIALTVLAFAWIGFTALPSAAQGCAMCQTVMPQAGEPIARGMFWCVLVLLTAPFAVSATIGGWLFYQYRRAARGRKRTASITALQGTHRQHTEVA